MLKVRCNQKLQLTIDVPADRPSTIHKIFLNTAHLSDMEMRWHTVSVGKHDSQRVRTACSQDVNQVGNDWICSFHGDE